jgi:hypothetical protein
LSEGNSFVEIKRNIAIQNSRDLFIGFVC